MDYQIKCYFQRFGVVTSVEIQQVSNADAHFALVEFETAETADMILSSNQTNWIVGNEVEVKAAEPWQQLDHFTKTKKLDLTKVSYKKGKNLLHTYGSTAQSIIVARESTQFLANDYEIEILTTIAECCTSELKELTLHNFRFEKTLPSDIKFGLALCNLEKLSFIDCHIREDLDGLLSSCVDLKVFRMECCMFHHDLFIWPKFKKLEELRLINFAAASGCPFVDGNKGLIAHCSLTLTKLSVLESPKKHFHNSLIMLEVMEIIVRAVPHLVELELDVPVFKDAELEDCIRQLGRLKYLKVLKIDLCARSVAPFSCTTLIAMPIEHMQLSNGKLDTNTIKNISKMKRLKILEFRNIDGLTDEGMIELAKGLGCRLEKLHLNGLTTQNLTTIGLKKMLPLTTKLSFFSLTSWNITIEKNDYKEMLEIVQKRPEKNMLLIELTGDGNQIKAPAAIRMKNCDSFYIEEKIGDDSDTDDSRETDDGDDDDDDNSMKF